MALNVAELQAVFRLKDESQAALQGIKSTIADLGKSASEFGKTLGEAFENPLGAVKSLGSEVVGNLIAPLGEAGLVAGGLAAGAALLGAELIHLAADARESAAAIYELHEVTGMSVAGVSALKFAVTAAGGSIDNTSRALFMFEQRMENSSEKVDKGLRMIGLSLKQIQGMSADERLLAISDALRATGEDTNKAAVAMDIFGRQGRDMLPQLLKPMRDLTDQAKDMGAVLSEEDAKAAHEFELSLNTLKASAGAAWTVLGLHVSIADEFTYGYERMKLAVANVALATVDLATGFGWFRAAADAITGSLGDLPPVAGPATDAMKKHAEAIKANDFKAVALSQADLNYAIHEETAAAEASIAANKKRATEMKKFSDALRDVTSAGEPFAVTLATIDGSVVEAVKNYHAHGAELSKLAEVYGLTKGQIDAIAESMKEEAKAIKLADDILKQHITNIENSRRIGEESAAAVDKAMGGQNVLLTMAQTMGNVGLSTTHIFSNMGRTIEDTSKQAKQHMDALKGATLDFAQVSALALGTLAQSFMGGGGLLGAIKAVAVEIGGHFLDQMRLAIEVAHDLNESVLTATTVKASAAIGAMSGLGAAMSGAGGKASVASAAMAGVGVAAAAIGAGATIGGAIALGAATAGIGIAAVGAYYGIKKLFFDSEKKVNPLRQQFIDAAGGLDLLNKRLMTATGSGDLMNRILNARNMKDYKAAVDDAEKALKTLNERLQKLNEEAGKTNQEMSSLYEISPGLDDALKDLFKASTPDEYAAALSRVNTEIANQKQAASDLDDTLKRYKLTWENLGDTARAQKLGEIANGLLNDFNRLRGAGVDVNLIYDKMGPSISDMVQAAKRSGTEIPASLQNIVQEAARMGVLLDENGDKITDLTKYGVTFGSTFEANMAKVATSMDKVVAALERIAKALGALPDAPTIPVPDVAGSSPNDGGGNQGQGDTGPGFASGTHGRLLNFGTGTQVTLHGREGVFTEHDARSSAGSNEALAGEISRLRRDLITILPLHIKAAVAQVA